MKKEELEIFYKLDRKSYCVDKNKTINSLLKSQGSRYQNVDVQAFIDKLIAWYNVKFSNEYIEQDLKENESAKDYALIEIMSFEKLQQNFDTLEMKLFTSEEGEMEVIRRYLVEMAGCGLIYSKNSCPKYGYYRASKLFEDFNDYFQWNLDVRIFDTIMERDYSPDNEDIIRFLARKKEERQEIDVSNRAHILRRFYSFIRK